MSGRPILVVALVAVIAAGGGYWYFGVFRPNQVKAAARDEVTAWEKRWTTARGCLLGAAPRSAKTSEALAIHELEPDPWDRGACTGLMAKLTRGDAPDTGIRTVEMAWRELDHAASKAAAAFAEHVTAEKLRPDDPLPAALDALDAARASLRATAGLPAETQAGPPPLAAAQLDRFGSDDLLELAPAIAPSASGFATVATLGSRHVQISVPAGGSPHVVLSPVNGRVAADGTWAANVDTSGQLVAGTIDAKGIVTPTATLKLPAALAAAPQVMIVSGTLADGLIAITAMGTDGSPVQATATVHGPTIALDPSFGELRLVDTAGHAMIVTRSKADKHAMARLVGYGTGVAAPLADDVGGGCFDGSRAWLFGQDTLYALDGRSPTPASYPWSGGFMIGCTPDGVVYVDAADEHGPTQRTLCTPTCHTVRFPDHVANGAVTSVGGKLVGVRVYGCVLEVWHESGAATFYSLPAGSEYAGVERIAYTNGKTIGVIVRDTTNHYAVASVPAT
jgi:hypothetical protein